MTFGTEDVLLWQLPISVIALTRNGFVPFSIFTELDTVPNHCLALLNLHSYQLALSLLIAHILLQQLGFPYVAVYI